METLDKLSKGKETVALRLFAIPLQYSKGMTFHVDVVYVKDSEKQYVDSMGFYHNYYDEKHQYKGLSLTGTVYEYGSQPHGYQVGISTSANEQSTLERAKQMVRVLSPIERKLNKLSDELGQPDTFEDYVCRLAKVLNVKAYYHTSLTSSSDRTEYRVDDIKSLKQTIANMIEFNTQAMAPVAA